MSSKRCCRGFKTLTVEEQLKACEDWMTDHPKKKEDLLDIEYPWENIYTTKEENRHLFCLCDHTHGDEKLIGEEKWDDTLCSNVGCGKPILREKRVHKYCRCRSELRLENREQLAAGYFMTFVSEKVICRYCRTSQNSTDTKNE